MADSEAADAEADVGSPADSASRRDPIGAVFSAASSSSSLASFLEREASSPSFSGRSSVSRRNVSKDAAASPTPGPAARHISSAVAAARYSSRGAPSARRRGVLLGQVLDAGSSISRRPRDHLREARRRRERRERLVALRDDLHREARVALLGSGARRRDAGPGGGRRGPRGSGASPPPRGARVREPERRDERRRAGEEAGLEDARRGVRRFRFVSSPRGDAHQFTSSAARQSGGGVAVVALAAARGGRRRREGLDVIGRARAGRAARPWTRATGAWRAQRPRAARTGASARRRRAGADRSSLRGGGGAIVSRSRACAS